MKRRLILVLVVVALCSTTRARVANAQGDLAGRWYDEIRGIIEDLAKQKLAEGLSKYMANDQHAACYYLSGSLGRLQSGYWGGVPGALREDGLELLGDWIYFMVTQADSTNLAASANAFIADANTRYAFGLAETDLAAGARPCSRQWWDDRLDAASKPIGVSLVYANCRGATPTDARTRLGCGVAQATMAYLRHDTASMKRHISDLTAWAMSEVINKSAGSLPPATVKAVAARLAGWIEDPASLKELLQTVSASYSTEIDNVLRSLSATCPDPIEILKKSGDIDPKDVGCLLLAFRKNASMLNQPPLILEIAGREEAVYLLKSDVARVVAELKAGNVPFDLDDSPGCPKTLKADLKLFGTIIASMRVKENGLVCSGEDVARDLISLVNGKLDHAFRFSYDVGRIEDVLAFAGATVEKIPEILDYIKKLESFLSKVDKQWDGVGQEWSLVLAIDVLRDAFRYLKAEFGDVDLATQLFDFLGPHEIETLTTWADQRNYRDIAITIFEVFEAKAADDKAQHAEIQLLAKFVSYVLDSTDGQTTDGLSSAAFRSAAIDYLSKVDKGFPVPASTDHVNFDGRWWFPSVAVRWSWNPDYYSAASSNGFRRVVTVDWPRLTFSVSRFAGFQFSLVDAVGPLAESALRDDADGANTNDWSILWDWVRPRVNAYFLIPQITRNVAFGISASWRLLEVQRKDGADGSFMRKYCGPRCGTWNRGTAEVDLGVLVAF